MWLAKKANALRSWVRIEQTRRERESMGVNWIRLELLG
jgi:hypothetical protein